MAKYIAFNNGLSWRGEQDSYVPQAGEVAFSSVPTPTTLAAAFPGYTAAVATQTAATNSASDLATKIAAGIAITSTGTPALNAIYALDSVTQNQIDSIAIAYAAGLGLPGGGSTFQYPDITGAPHTFTGTQLVNLRAAMQGYLLGVEQQAAIEAAGGSAKLANRIGDHRMRIIMRKFLIFLVALLMPSLAWAQGTTTTQVAITPSTGAYSAGQCIGPAGANAIMTIPGMVRVNGPGGTIIAQVDITDTTASNAAIDIFLFNALPSGTYTDQANCIIATADQDNLVGIVVNTTFSCIKDESSATGICQATPAILMTPAVTPPKTSSLWAVAIMRGTPTYGATQKLYFNFKAFPD